MRPKTILIGAIAVATAVYPFIVYFGLDRFGTAALALILFAALLVRLLLLGKHERRAQFVQLLLVGSLCLLAAWFQSETLLRYYPVLMNFGFAAFFWFSLSSDQSLIERFARVFIQDISAHAKRYMRGLTKVWALLLLLNSVIALYTACCLSIKQWALYNGAIAYIVFGVFTLFELVYRHYYKKRHQL